VPNLIPLGDRAEAFTKLARTGQFRKCPGGSEVAAVDNSNVWSADVQKQLDCSESTRGAGPIK
jgi:hypothetical protein